MIDTAMSYSLSDGSRPDTKVLTITGPLVLQNMFKLQSELRSLHLTCLIVDLTGVPYMDSAGLGVLMNSFVSAQTHGKKMLLVGVNERVRTLFELTKVDSVLEMCDSIATAEAQV